MQAQLLDPICPAPSKVDCTSNPTTIFAPTNAAFDNLASDLGISLDDLLNLSNLTDILLYHISDHTSLLVPQAASDGDLVRLLHPVILAFCDHLPDHGNYGNMLQNVLFPGVVGCTISFWSERLVMKCQERYFKCKV